MSASVYGFNEATGKFSYFSTQQDWESQISAAGARNFLISEVRASLVNDLPPYFDLVRGKGIGFWAGARMVMPYISFLGSLYKGRDTSLNSIAFIEEYFGRRGRRTRKKGYLDYGAALFTMWRHGLIHTHMPKVFRRQDGYLVQWAMTDNPNHHLEVSANTKKKLAWLYVSSEGLYEDLLDALDEFSADFASPSLQAERLAKFKEGFIKMARVFAASDLPGTAQQKKVEASLNTII